MVSVRSALRSALSALGAAAFIAAGAVGTPAQSADYRFEAGYRITLNGLQIGRAELRGSIEGASYRLDGSARLTGIAGMLFDFTSTAAAAGRLGARGASPSAFSADSSDGRRNMSVRMTMVDNAVRQLRLEPPVPAQQDSYPERVLITDAHRRNIVDPITAMVAFGAYDGERFSRALCRRALPIFNGRERFDVELEYRGTRTVSSNLPGGYSGPTLVCEARYRAVAGHRADRAEVKQLEERMVFEVMMAPIEGSDIVLPYRVTVPTPLGAAAIQVVSLTTSGALANRSAALAE